MPKARLNASVLLLLAINAGCASATRADQAAVTLARADEMLSQGCYDCLVEARDAYAAIVAGKERRAGLPRLFETTVLLGLREKELGLNSSGQFENAKGLLRTLPNSYAGLTYLQIATALLPDSIGTSARGRSALKRPTAAQYAEWQASLQTGPGSALFRRYLSIGLDCSFGISLGRRSSGGGTDGAETSFELPPASSDPPGALLAYRRANCGAADTGTLASIADANKRFVEAGALAARTLASMRTQEAIVRAKTALNAGVRKWPASPVFNLAFAAYFRAVGDCNSAIAYYDKTLSADPLHEQALLGRLICLSNLTQYAVAISQAGTMIADGVQEGESRYWRAWNEYALGRLKEARLDTDRMKQLLLNDRALTLAGQIEHDQDDLGVAEKDLTEARQLNQSNCTAAWYWALVQLKLQAWTPTADGFVRAMACYESALVDDTTRLDEMRVAENVDEEFRAKQILGFETAIKEDVSQISASALNAASSYARANNRAKALEYCDLAAKDPDRAKQVAELRALIVK